MNNKKIKIITPATSGNVGPGFDCAGLALDFYNEFHVSLSDKFSISGIDVNYQNEDYLFYKSFMMIAKIFDVKVYPNVIIKANIPFSRGLGSSATLVCAGVVSANFLISDMLKKDKISDEELIKIACGIEGHPDNVISCFYGGYNISFIEDEKIFNLKKEVNNKLNFTFLIPPYPLDTIKSRQVLKTEYSRKDAIYNISHLPILIDALENANVYNLKNAIKDKLHVDYRKKLIKNYDLIEEICLKNDAICMTISGAGSTLLAISTIKNFSSKISNEIKKIDKDIIIKDIKVNNTGLKIYDMLEG